MSIVLSESYGYLYDSIYEKWNELPKVMQNDKVKYYYDILQEHEKELKLKRAFDIICSLIMIIILSPVLIILSVMIKLILKDLFYLNRFV